MSELSVRSIDAPDETIRMVDKGRVDVVKLGGTAVNRLTLDPGWTWRQHEQPLFGTDICELEHVGFCVAGRVKIVMTDGDEQEIAPGAAFYIPPGHDAWVVGDEPFVAYLFGPLVPEEKQVAPTRTERAEATIH